MKKDHNQDLAFWLSSYLDGELTESQAQKVEKQLAEDQSARQLLVDLQHVAGWVSQLPKERAPDHLGEDILFELERHQLLNSHESISEKAGKNHLFVRRFVAAAAMIFLVGVVGTIIYQVLFAPIEPLNTKTAMETKEQTPLVENPTNKDQRLASAEPQRETLIDEAALKYGSIDLEVLAPSAPPEGMIENLLTELAIERFVPIHLSARNRQYAFMCQAGQLSDLFAKLETQPDHQVRVIVTDADSNLGRKITLTKVEISQLLQLAMITESSQQFALADAFMNLSLDKKNRAATRLAQAAVDRKISSPFQANPNPPSHKNKSEIESQNLLPDWLADTWVKNEPELTGLELLGPADWPKEENFSGWDSDHPNTNRQPNAQDNTAFVANVPATNQNAEENTPPVVIPVIDTHQMVAIVLTYKVQEKPTGETNTDPELIVDPNNVTTENKH